MFADPVENILLTTNESRVRNVPRSKTSLRALNVRFNRPNSKPHLRRDFFSDESSAQAAQDLELTRGEGFHRFIHCRESITSAPTRQNISSFIFTA